MLNNKKGIETRLLPLTNDLVFKAVYGRNTEASKAALIALLNRLLGKEKDPIVWLNCENPFNYRTCKEEKETIMDIKVRLSSGQLLDLEMQVNHLSEYVNRSIYYMGKLINESLESGEDYDMMKESIIISIVDGTLFGEFEKVYSTYYLKEDETNHKLSELTQINFLELGKIDISMKQISEMTPHERLGAYFKYAADDSLTEYIDQLLEYEREVIDLTKPILEEISKEKEMREIAFAHEMWLHDVATIKARARKQAIAEGKAEGLAEGLAEGKAVGLAEGKSVGETTKLLRQICKKLSKGKKPEVIAYELEEDLVDILPMIEIALTYAPDYDIEQIYDALNNETK